MAKNIRGVRFIGITADIKKPLAVTASGFPIYPSYSFVTMGMIMGLRLVCL